MTILLLAATGDATTLEEANTTGHPHNGRITVDLPYGTITQGTIVKATLTFTQANTRTLEDPDDAYAIIVDPDGNRSTMLASRNEITHISTGIYEAGIDTSPTAGTWEVEFGSTGPDATVTQRILNVQPDL